ncbi:TadE/TadG family type IV pilus assembly protein [Amphiplicatus metriothermophilus]|uniref:TadE-like protein n=1 Tax=Amphiplicatus metriothermophilus TaxID=1519374 RepID=A0A239PY71_9PROT|nr:TadE/TadG family type IV pilus assembly protein [Amphiplicatus metriothermophilus]MBB5519779.1 Flp pilus assembly protein TadG [Amphiplicatus metriothermophilus]SNT75205.1 TadE-like protein [Amphiplicatus metriothermophilus]
MIGVSSALRRLRRDRRGVSAVEFAILSPLFFALVFAIVNFGFYFAAANSVQQLCGDIARASVAGLDEEERVSIARSYLEANYRNYVLLKREYLSLEVADSEAQPDQFDVRVEYDGAALPTAAWSRLLRREPPVILGVATVKHGGF